MKSMCCVFILASIFLSAGSQAAIPYASSLVSGGGADVILSSFLSDRIRLPQSKVVPLLLLEKGKKGLTISSPVSEGEGLQPDKGTVFTGYSFELNLYGNENKKQTKTGSQSQSSKQGRQSEKQPHKKQPHKRQGGSGSSGSSGTGAATASGNDESRARHLEKLKEILKAAEKSLKTMDQKKNIDDFKAELRELYEQNPGILEEKGSLENSEYRWKGVLKLLELYFPEKLETGEMTHILLEYPEFKRVPEIYIRSFAKAVLPDLELPEGLPKYELLDRVLDAASPEIIRLMHAYLGFPQCLHQLVSLFVTQLPLMAAQKPKNYIFQVKTGHVSVVSIRRNSRGHFQVFFADSLTVFKQYHADKTYSPLPHFVGLALILAIKYHGFTDSQFFFLPPRQAGGFGCESFALHDLETLLESPVLSENGYYADEEPLTKDNMLSFYSQIMYLEGSEQPGQLVINGERTNYAETLDKSAFDTYDLDFLILMSLGTWQKSGLESDLVKLHQLCQFPSRFAHLTQGQQNLERLLENFPEECQKEVNQIIDETRGLLTVNDGTCRNNVNLAATLLWMKMNIDLLDMNRPGQEK